MCASISSSVHVLIVDPKIGKSDPRISPNLYSAAQPLEAEDATVDVPRANQMHLVHLRHVTGEQRDTKESNLLSHCIHHPGEIIPAKPPTCPSCTRRCSFKPRPAHKKAMKMTAKHVKNMEKQGVLTLGIREAQTKVSFPQDQINMLLQNLQTSTSLTKYISLGEGSRIHIRQVP
jgi:hypothetical protein